MFNRKYVIIVFSVLAAALLWPAAMVAAPPEPVSTDILLSVETPQAQNDLFPLYSSYEWSDKTGPGSCPPQDPFPVFKYGTRSIYSYAPVTISKDLSFAILWYELDKDGKIIGDEPFAATTFDAKAGDLLPFGALTLNQAASGNVGVVMMVQEGKEWLNAAFGVYVIAGKGVQAPQPGECPLE